MGMTTLNLYNSEKRVLPMADLSMFWIAYSAHRNSFVHFLIASSRCFFSMLIKILSDDST